MLDLPIVFAGILAFAVLAYVILDGFDLGIGILFPFLPEKAHRDTAMNSVAPVWDGNETWLVLGGGGLLAAFPVAYAVVMPALYAPIIAMLLALVFRGVAFEFRWRAADQRRWLWDWSFAGGSIVAGFAQGIALGALVQGIQMTGRGYGGGWYDWLSPFSVATGVALVIGYALLGSTWLIMKTEGDLQERARHYAMRTGVGTLAAIGLVSLWTPFLQPVYWDRWFAWPIVLVTMLVPAAVAGSAWLLYRGIRDRSHHVQPFLAALALFVLSFIGIGISFYPNIVPPDLTIHAAAAPDSSLAFILVGTVILVPAILAYTAFAYWVFRGKVDASGGYHH
jgi:cytochrome bd ubiquinol oxidase subunit II